MKQWLQVYDLIEILRAVIAQFSIVAAPSELQAPLSSAPLPQTLAECHAVILSQAQALGTLQAQAQLLQERVNLNSGN